MDGFWLSIIALTLTGSQVVTSYHLGISGGHNAAEGEFPFSVQLVQSGFYLCGGSILNEKWILTAAHCLSAPIDAVVYGTNKLYHADNPAGSLATVKQSIRHPNFHHNNFGVSAYDIGLLELNEPLKFSDNVKAVKIADVNATEPIKVDGVTVGWGTTSVEIQAENLQKLELQLSPPDECAKDVSQVLGSVYNPEDDICYLQKENGPCYGDSGNPLLFNGVQYGITSWTTPCPVGLFARISNPEYREFVTKHTGI